MLSKERIDDLAGLMEEFGLSEAEIKGKGWSVMLRKSRPPVAMTLTREPSAAEGTAIAEEEAYEPAAPIQPTGTPINSPMHGIYYGTQSPGAPPFAKEGDNVNVGDVVGLIEAMKVFNEITSPVAGRVLRVVAENGSILQPGDPILYIG